MALYAIADTHLSLSVQKPMDIFSGWGDYMSRLESNWRENVGEQDTVVVAGDISWAMTTDEAYEDFRFLNSLPGKKILLKGNHDYWWMTRKKIDEWIAECGFSSISFLFNDSYVCENTGICGTRGWFFEQGEEQSDKVLRREAGRLERSLLSQTKSVSENIVFLHYPPVFSGEHIPEFIDIMKRAGVKRCYYGHVHGKSIKNAFCGEYDGISFRLISADYLNFSPLRIK